MHRLYSGLLSAFIILLFPSFIAAEDRQDAIDYLVDQVIESTQGGMDEQEALESCLSLGQPICKDIRDSEGNLTGCGYQSRHRRCFEGRRDGEGNLFYTCQIDAVNNSCSCQRNRTP